MRGHTARPPAQGENGAIARPRQRKDALRRKLFEPPVFMAVPSLRISNLPVSSLSRIDTSRERQRAGPHFATAIELQTTPSTARTIR